ncbi:MAG: hypothetical protein K2J76_07340, partial [Oscillospiraceae bacterium]|nr:hypothetical protein [Oscillospiraceae bacterium]
KSYCQIGQIFDVMYPDKDTNPDYSDALNVYYKIDSTGIKNTEMLQCFNELLYIFNNALINLRPGDSSWNRSIGGCYDPESWYPDKNRFVINSKEDVHILDNLLKIFVNPSTIYFYTAQTHSGDLLLYSSNNSFPYEGIKAYSECNIPIFIRFSDGKEKQITFP